MAKRKLKRQLSLLQVIMLALPAPLLQKFSSLQVTSLKSPVLNPSWRSLSAVCSRSHRLNYCELATTFPVTAAR